jgi:hypothetical protein
MPQYAPPQLLDGIPIDIDIQSIADSGSSCEGILRPGSLRAQLWGRSRGPGQRAWLQPCRLHPLDCCALISGYKVVDKSTRFTVKLS